MKRYPEIQGSNKCPRAPCIAFYKYDGSNLRWEWSRKRGWYKFGTRRRMFDHTDEMYGQAIPIFMGDLAEPLEKIFVDKFRADSVIVFTEFFGPKSFAGQHAMSDPKQLVLFDVNIKRKGIMPPRDFVKYFGSFDFASRVVYDGNLNEQLIERVRSGYYPDLNEGIVCKGVLNRKVWMAKIKTDDYKRRLKEFYLRDWEQYWE